MVLYGTIIARCFKKTLMVSSKTYAEFSLTKKTTTYTQKDIKPQ